MRLAKPRFDPHPDSLMKGKAAFIVLLIACLFLAIFLVFNRQKATEEITGLQYSITILSNTLNNTTSQLTEQQQVNLTLTGFLTDRTSELVDVSNRLVVVRADLVRSEEQAAAAAIAAQQEMAKRDARINELTGQNDEMTRRMADLDAVLTELEGQILETERKLASSEGDREFLLVELKRLQSEKAELERQLTDLALLRDQIRKLRDELSIARRIEWIRRGLYGSEQRGAERLEPGHATPAHAGYDLEVEIRQEGAARIVEPTDGGGAPKP
jgi:chromosome segregation ATPase